MMKTGTILKAMQAVLLVTVLTPATVHADPLSTRQMLAQAQTQGQEQAVKGEVKRINRGLILGTAEAATNPNAQRPVEIPAISAPAVTAPTPPAPVATIEAPKVDIPALPTAKVETPVVPPTKSSFETASAPSVATTAQTSTSSIVTLPAPVQLSTDTSSAPVTSNASTADVVTTPAPVSPVAPAPIVETPATVATPAATTTSVTKVETTKADTTTTTKVTSTKTAITHQSRSRHHSDDSFDVGGFNISSGNINRQLTKFINRSDVKSILAQYCLN